MASQRKNSSPAWLGVLLLSTLLLCGCKKDPSQQEQSDDNDRAAQQTSIVSLSPKQVALAGIKSAVVGKGDVNLELNLNGEVGFDLNRLTHITPGIAGVVRQVKQTAGDKVEASAVLVVLSSRELAQAKSQYLAARQRVELSRKDFERIESLWKDKITAEQQYLDAQQALAEANIVLQTATQSLYTLGLSREEVTALPQAAASRLGRYEVKAPFAGTLVEQHVSEGEQVQADTELFVLTPLDTLWVMASVYEPDIAKIRRGQSGTVTVQAYPNQQFSGKVTWIDDAIDEQTRTLQVRLEVPNEKRLLKAGMFANVKLTVGEEKDVLNVPATAIQTKPDSTFVFVETGKGHYERRDVQIGARSEDTVEIRSGLTEGRRVVTEGAALLESELEKGSFGDND